MSYRMFQGLMVVMLFTGGLVRGVAPPLPRDHGQIRLLEGGRDHTHCVDFSPDGKRIAVAAYTFVTVYCTASGKRVNEVTPFRDWARFAFFGRGGKVLVCGGGDADSEICLLNATNLNNIIKVRLPGNDRINGCVVSPDRQQLAVGGDRGEVSYWDTATVRLLGTHPCSTKKNMVALAYTKDGKRVAAVDERGVVFLCDPVKRTSLGEVMRRTSGWPHIAISPVEDLLSTGNHSTTGFVLWDLKRGRIHADVRWKHRGNPKPIDIRRRDFVDTAGINHSVFSRDGKTLFTACCDGTVRVWELSTLAQRYVAELAAFRLVLSPDGTLLAGFGAEEYKGVRLWSWREGGRTREDPGPRLSEEQTWAALASDDASLAFGVMRDLLAAPDTTIRYLRSRLKPAEGASVAAQTRLIGDLDSDSYATRQAAHETLSRLGRLVEPTLRKALRNKPSLTARRSIQRLLKRLEGPTPEELQALRCVEVAEALDTRESRQLLGVWAKGVKGATLTEDAGHALRRMVPAEPN